MSSAAQRLGPPVGPVHLHPVVHFVAILWSRELVSARIGRDPGEVHVHVEVGLGPGVMQSLEQAEELGLAARHARPQEVRRVGAGEQAVVSRGAGPVLGGTHERVTLPVAPVARIDGEKADVWSVAAQGHGDDAHRGVAQERCRLVGCEQRILELGLRGGVAHRPLAERNDRSEVGRAELVHRACRIGERLAAGTRMGGQAIPVAFAMSGAAGASARLAGEAQSRELCGLSHDVVARVPDDTRLVHHAFGHEVGPDAHLQPPRGRTGPHVGRRLERGDPARRADPPSSKRVQPRISAGASAGGGDSRRGMVAGWSRSSVMSMKAALGQHGAYLGRGVPATKELGPDAGASDGRWAQERHCGRHDLPSGVVLTATRGRSGGRRGWAPGRPYRRR